MRLPPGWGRHDRDISDSPRSSVSSPTRCRHTMRLEFSRPFSRKRLAFSIQAPPQWCRKLQTHRMLYLFGLVQPRKLLTSAQACGGVSTPCKLCSLLMRLTARAARLPWSVVRGRASLWTDVDTCRRAGIHAAAAPAAARGRRGRRCEGAMMPFCTVIFCPIGVWVLV